MRALSSVRCFGFGPALLQIQCRQAIQRHRELAVVAHQSETVLQGRRRNARIGNGQSQSPASLLDQKLLTPVRNGGTLTMDLWFPAIPRALIATSQGLADDQGGRFA